MLDKVTADMVLKFEIDSACKNTKPRMYPCRISLLNNTKKEKSLTMDKICALFATISNHNILVEEELKNRILSHLFVNPEIKNSAKVISEKILTQLFVS